MIGALERSFWWWIKYTTDGHWRLKLKSGCSLESQQLKKYSTFSGKVRQNSQIVYMWISFCLFRPLRARQRKQTDENYNDGISAKSDNFYQFLCTWKQEIEPPKLLNTLSTDGNSPSLGKHIGKSNKDSGARRIHQQSSITDAIWERPLPRPHKSSPPMRRKWGRTSPSSCWPPRRTPKTTSWRSPRRRPSRPPQRRIQIRRLKK